LLTASRIVFRAFQGVGGSGLFSMATVVGLKVTKPAHANRVAIYLGLTQTVAVILGPILGGVIDHDRNGSTWRWIFWLNVPICGIAFVAFVAAWPQADLGQQGRRGWRSIDVVGAGLLLVATVLLIVGLQEAGARVITWQSPTSICSFSLAGCAITAFVLWESAVERRSDWSVTAVFPLRLVCTRVTGAAMM
jgi:MFS family permease